MKKENQAHKMFIRHKDVFGNLGCVLEILGVAQHFWPPTMTENFIYWGLAKIKWN